MSHSASIKSNLSYDDFCQQERCLFNFTNGSLGPVMLLPLCEAEEKEKGWGCNFCIKNSYNSTASSDNTRLVVTSFLSLIPFRMSIKVERAALFISSDSSSKNS
jgi:hypothetical protein